MFVMVALDVQFVKSVDEYTVVFCVLTAIYNDNVDDQQIRSQ